MNRRKFLTQSIATTSVFTLAGGLSLAASQNEEVKKKTKSKCKITVIRKEHFVDLNLEIKGKEDKPCPEFEIGQEFVFTKWWECPDGFCNWAWADIRPIIQLAFSKGKTMAACCTDGFRPVVFKIEKIEEIVEG